MRSTSWRAKIMLNELRASRRYVPLDLFDRLTSVYLYGDSSPYAFEPERIIKGVHRTMFHHKYKKVMINGDGGLIKEVDGSQVYYIHAEEARTTDGMPIWVHRYICVDCIEADLVNDFEFGKSLGMPLVPENIMFCVADWEDDIGYLSCSHCDGRIKRRSKC